MVNPNRKALVMTPPDIDHLFQAMAELRAEVKGYRADLNGRLRSLEREAAEQRGKNMGQAGVGRWIIGVAAVAASIGSVVGAIIALI